MKILQNILEYLAEGREGYLYHGTSLRRAEVIVSSNTLKAESPVMSTDIPQEFKGHKRTVSFTRTLGVAKEFAIGAAGQGVPVILVIDHQKLSNLVGRRLQPYDSTATEWHRAQMLRWGNSTGNIKGSLRNHGVSEAEEMVFGDILNIDSTIAQIIIYLGEHPGEEQYKLVKKSPLLTNPKVRLIDSFRRAEIIPTGEKWGHQDLYTHGLDKPSITNRTIHKNLATGEVGMY